MDYESSIIIDAAMSPLPDAENFADLIRSVYKSVADEYSAWSKTYAEIQLSTLSRDNIRSSRLIGKPSVRRPSKVHLSSSPEEPFAFTFTNITSTSTNSYTLKPQIIEAPHIEQHAGYDICTPSSKNLMLGDDPDCLPFLPFADDPKYNYNFDLMEYSNIAWDNTTMQESNPDIEVVLIETLRRLQMNHRLTRDGIDQNGVLPMTTASIVQCSQRRNLPKWPVFSDFKTLPKKDPVDRIPSANLTREKFDYLMLNFCNHPNCLTGFCFTHTTDALLPLPAQPTLTYQELVSNMKEACKNDCILSPPPQVIPKWTNDDSDLLAIILETSPDALSCEIAPLLRKPCRDIHNYRLQHLNTREVARPLEPRAKKVLEDTTPLSLSTHEPCRHAGPCNKAVDCSCFRYMTRCWNTCRCSQKCNRRWTGCKCGKTGKSCGTTQCACYKAHMECDSALCVSCGATDLDCNNCANVSIQRNKFKATEVRHSKYGLGLFTLEPCYSRELIAEYAGEIIYEPTVRSRHPHTVQVGRCYVFGLAVGACLDSASAGNESRFINHSSKPNCKSRLILVHGQHRIGIYASRQIKAGEELFIDYGSEFPIEDSSTADATQDQAART